MNFLNEISGRYPEAISLAAGRPTIEFTDTTDIERYLNAFVEYMRNRGEAEEDIGRRLLQYGPTNGFINEFIARMLRTDLDIHVSDESIVVTVGCQEAMLIALRGLFAAPADVLLVAEPCYVGIIGAARLLGITVRGVPESGSGLDPATVSRVASSVRASGRNPRALYLVPDFANPSGHCLDAATRREILAVAEEEDLMILEDDPYGLFGADEHLRPRLKSLDTRRRVIYFGSFAKSCFPGVRVGFLVADQWVGADGRPPARLAELLGAVKSMVTVNTSPVSQAVVAGMLISAKWSLRSLNDSSIKHYRRNLDAMSSALRRHFPHGSGVTFTVPSGGFFVTVELPVEADQEFLELCAGRHRVVWTPMRFFYLDGGGERAVRLSFSDRTAEEIDEGVRRLAVAVREARLQPSVTP